MILNETNCSKLRNTPYICFQKLFFFKRNHYRNRNMEIGWVPYHWPYISCVWYSIFPSKPWWKDDFYFPYTVSRVGMRSCESKVKESYESLRRTKFPKLFFLEIWSGFGRFGCALKNSASKSKLMWCFWRMDECRLNRTLLNGCFRRSNVSESFLIKDHFNVQSCTLKIRTNNFLSDWNKS